MGEFSGKTVLITGAGSGIGKATAIAFAAEGAAVIVSDLSTDGGNQAVAEITAAGGSARFIACDVSDQASVDALFDEAIATFGRIDCAVNNAGIDIELSPEPQWDVAVFDRIISINVRGAFLCMRREVEHMRAQGGGAIVNLGSYASVAGVPYKPAYTASKHAVLGMTRSAGVFYAKHKIAINAICPGSVNTAMIHANIEIIPGGEATLNAFNPAGRLIEPQEIADAALWLCSPRAGSLVGHALMVDGGQAAQ